MTLSLSFLSTPFLLMFHRFFLYVTFFFTMKSIKTYCSHSRHIWNALINVENFFCSFQTKEMLASWKWSILHNWFEMLSWVRRLDKPVKDLTSPPPSKLDVASQEYLPIRWRMISTSLLKCLTSQSGKVVKGGKRVRKKEKKREALVIYLVNELDRQGVFFVFSRS